MGFLGVASNEIPYSVSIPHTVMAPSLAGTAYAGAVRTLLALGLDLVMVTAYALAFSRSRAEEMTPPASLWTNAWPFLVGLAVGWLVLRQWRNVFSAYRSVGVWLLTCVVGLLLRYLLTDATVPPWALVVSTTAVLGYLLLGWRLIVFLFGTCGSQVLTGGAFVDPPLGALRGDQGADVYDPLPPLAPGDPGQSSGLEVFGRSSFSRNSWRHPPSIN